MPLSYLTYKNTEQVALNFEIFLMLVRAYVQNCTKSIICSELTIQTLRAKSLESIKVLSYF